MRQQLTDTAVGPGRQPVHHILEIDGMVRPPTALLA